MTKGELLEILRNEDTLIQEPCLRREVAIIESSRFEPEELDLLAKHFRAKIAQMKTAKAAKNA